MGAFRIVIQKPVADNHKCKLCGECWKICPAKVISHNTKGIQFDYDKCIRCYCCLEVCTHGALEAKEPLLGKLQTRSWEQDGVTRYTTEIYATTVQFLGGRNDGGRRNATRQPTRDIPSRPWPIPRMTIFHFRVMKTGSHRKTSIFM